MNAISTPIQALLDLFADSLPDVRFGDVDAQTLGRVAADVDAAAKVVTAAEASLDSARSALQEKQDMLLQHMQRALAYARVYAEADQALSARLATIALPRTTRRARADIEPSSLSNFDIAPPSRGRGRPRKANGAAPTPSLQTSVAEDAE